MKSLAHMKSEAGPSPSLAQEDGGVSSAFLGSLCLSFGFNLYEPRYHMHVAWSGGVLQALEGIQWAAERGDGVVALKPGLKVGEVSNTSNPGCARVHDFGVLHSLPLLGGLTI